MRAELRRVVKLLGVGRGVEGLPKVNSREVDFTGYINEE
jgi:hypothetical protein